MHVQVTDDEVLLDVTDRGPGFPDADPSTRFQAFARRVAIRVVMVSASGCTSFGRSSMRTPAGRGRRTAEGGRMLASRCRERQTETGRTVQRSASVRRAEADVRARPEDATCRSGYRKQLVRVRPREIRLRSHRLSRHIPDRAVPGEARIRRVARQPAPEGDRVFTHDDAAACRSDAICSDAVRGFIPRGRR